MSLGSARHRWNNDIKIYFLKKKGVMIQTGLTVPRLGQDLGHIITTLRREFLD